MKFEGDIVIRKTYTLRECGKICHFFNEKKVTYHQLLILLEICNFYFYQKNFIINRPTIMQFMNFKSEEKLDLILKSLGPSFNESYHFVGKLFQILEDQREKIDHLRGSCKTEINVTRLQYLDQRNRLRNLKFLIIYNIYIKNITSWQKKKEQLESALQSSTKDKITIKRQISEVKMKLCELSQFINTLEDAIEDLSKEENYLIKKSEKIKCKIESHTEELHFLTEKCVAVNLRRIDTDSGVKVLCEKLESVKEALGNKQNCYIKLKSSLLAKREVRSYLLEKLKVQEILVEGNKLNWLQDKISSARLETTTLGEDIKKILNINANLFAKRESLLQQVDNLKKTNISQKDDLSKEILDNKGKLSLLQSELRELRHKEMFVFNELKLMSKNIQKMSFQLQKKVGKSIIKGIESIGSIIDNLRLSDNSLFDGYLGMVIDNFKCHDTLNLAIETAIGSRLFFHIITDNKIGIQILNLMKNNGFPGEVSFIPLNRIITQCYDYPLQEGAKPLLNYLEYSADMKDVMQFLFGGVMICRDLDIAVSVAKYSGFTCVTIQGDKVSGKQDIFGGYIDATNSSLKVFKEISMLQVEFSKKTNEIEKINNRIQEYGDKINKTISGIQSNKVLLLSYSEEKVLQQLFSQIKAIENDIMNNENIISKKQCSAYGLEGYIQYLEEDLHQGFAFDLKDLRNQLLTLNKEITDLNKLIKEAEFKVFETEQEKIKLKDVLENYEKKHQLNNSEKMAIENCKNNINEYNTKYCLVNIHLNQVQKELKNKSEIISQSVSIKNNADKILKNLLEFKENSENESIKDKLISRISNYNSKIASSYSFIKYFQEKYNTSLVLHKKFENHTTSNLLKRLKEIKRDLEKIEAKYELNTFSAADTTEFMPDRFQTLERNFSKFYLSFSRFIEWTHEIIEAKIEMVSDSFYKLHHQISPNIESFLFADDDGSSRNWPVLPNISGINICMAFGESEDLWDLKNLSLGQKICIFLALRFSFIEVTSAPFFILDEIDVALRLGTEERRLIHEMINSFSNAVQIFLSAHTFEAVSQVQSIFCVEMEGMKSTVKKASTGEQDSQ